MNDKKPSTAADAVWIGFLAAVMLVGGAVILGHLLLQAISSMPNWMLTLVGIAFVLIWVIAAVDIKGKPRS